LAWRRTFPPPFVLLVARSSFATSAPFPDPVFPRGIPVVRFPFFFVFSLRIEDVSSLRVRRVPPTFTFFSLFFSVTLRTIYIYALVPPPFLTTRDLFFAVQTVPSSSPANGDGSVQFFFFFQRSPLAILFRGGPLPGCSGLYRPFHLFI